MMEKAMATHSSTLAWEIPWTEEPGRLHTVQVVAESDTTERLTSLSLFPFMHLRRKWQPTPVFLPGESQEREPGGLPSTGSQRAGHYWRDLAAAAAAAAALHIRWPKYWSFSFSISPASEYSGLIFFCRDKAVIHEGDQLISKCT